MGPYDGPHLPQQGLFAGPLVAARIVVGAVVVVLGGADVDVVTSAPRLCSPGLPRS